MKKQQLQRRNKSRRQAETMGFTCFLVYFLVKAIVLLLLYKYDNLLKHEPLYIIPFGALLLINSYLMLTAGKDPGFETASLQQKEVILFQRTENNFCEICNCRKKNRTKHCYYCGKCVRKFDHHCPWIGACVGEKNHFQFWLSLLGHTVLSLFTAFILYQSLSYYTYQKPDGSYSAEYGSFALFCFFMVCYFSYASPLLLLHTYLLAANLTTRELLSRKKCHYLSNVNGNPFSKGLCQNLRMAIYVQEQGRQWLIEEQDVKGKESRSYLSMVWQNQYYSCC